MLQTTPQAAAAPRGTASDQGRGGRAGGPRPGTKRGMEMRILGIDYGDARTGLSVSDPSGFLAGSPSVIHEWNYDKLVDKLVAFVSENRIEEIVLGWPKNMDGTAGPRAESARRSPKRCGRAPACRSFCGTSAAPRSRRMRSCTKAARK